MSRLYSQKQNSLSLADALGLLLPKKSVKATTQYKPSLFRNFQKGSVTEHFDEIKHELVSELKLPETGRKHDIDSLLADLTMASRRPKHRVPQQDMKRYVQALESEEELLELLRLAFYQKELLMQLMTRFMLNKKLRDLSKLPFDVHKMTHATFASNGWTETEFAEFKILLMKKYFDTDKPMLIVRILKESFDKEFLPKIRARQLVPFYERIVWKFYFEYAAMGTELEVIKELDCVRSSFLIWESASAQSDRIARGILNHNSLSPAQALFLRLVTSAPVKQQITLELQLGRSPLLSTLKRLSAKLKIYNISNAGDVVSRASLYAMVNLVEKLVGSAFPNWHDEKCLLQLMGEFQQLRSGTSLTEMDEVETIQHPVYAH